MVSVFTIDNSARRLCLQQNCQFGMIYKEKGLQAFGSLLSIIQLSKEHNGLDFIDDRLNGFIRFKFNDEGKLFLKEADFKPAQYLNYYAIPKLILTQIGGKQFFFIYFVDRGNLNCFEIKSKKIK